ncbi:MAG: hypothetical protein R3C05_13960 [Pirellulaceae bacterium]
MLPKKKDDPRYWSGKANLAPINIVVKEVPVAERRMGLTDSQVKLMRILEPMLRGEKVSDEDFSLVSKDVPKMLLEIENERFALEVIRLLCKYIARDDGSTDDVNNRKTDSWVSLFRWVARRAYGFKSIKYSGPYLSEFAKLNNDSLEMHFKTGDGSPFSKVFAMAYLSETDEPVNAAIRDRLREIALANAKHHNAWAFLLYLNELKDGMLMTEAVQLIGNPTYDDERFVGWETPGGRRIRLRTPTVRAEIAWKDGRATLVFERGNLHNSP